VSADRLLVVTGMSGAGKSSALRSLEDLGFYCVDNLPPQLIPTVLELCARTTPRMQSVALAVDARTRNFLQQFTEVWPGVAAGNLDARLLFLDAEDAILRQRFSETRRPHPLAGNGGIEGGIGAERELLQPLRELADDVLDTSSFNVRSLREYLLERFSHGPRQGLSIAVTSFGYRNGLVDNADLVFDVRFLPNPHYDPVLRPQTGLDRPVREFVESRPETQTFLEHIDGLLRFLLPQYAEEGKSYLTIAFGCTGGRHRSVALAEIVSERLESLGYPTGVTHADLGGEKASRAAGR
jgi:UPF0042 nucleotide-binding protein